MTIQSINSNIERIQREIQSYNKKLSDEQKKEADKTKRIYHINQSITKTTSLSSLESKQMEINRLEKDIVDIQKKKADISKKIADKTTELHKYQQQLFREQDREQKKLLDVLKRQDIEIRMKQNENFRQIGSGNINLTRDIQYDAFISHASEDKEELVRPLAEKLSEVGFKIWYDEFQLKVGDSLRKSIDKGLSNSRFGIVVLSPSFFAKNWPQYELDGLVAKEMEGGKVILPLWHKVSKNEVLKFSPSLAGKIALSTTMYTIDEIVEKLAEALR